MAYQVYLGDLLLPVAPAKIETKIDNQNESVKLINDGEVNILKAPGLREISFEALLPQVEYPFSVYPDGFQAAIYYLNRLRSLKTAKKPFQFKCRRSGPAGEDLFDTVMSVSLEDYQVTENVEDGPDVTVSVNLKEYKDRSTKTVSVKNGKATVTQKRGTASAPQKKTYTVKKGDTLWAIAKKCLGDGARYQEIYNLNKSKLKSPNQLTVGVILSLPS